ncbi:carbohydrate-selective porin, OprB family [Coleofasciculus chthonoplastes PCC 7420]|uniref:Carbohydrate-selective porin, OprB family n=1 Tax=Coleofasciculus chthonoplastes PCC 7420 TaxID=118168 RepID=B4VSB5_9CYAN|nr:iron uptake porin [Coleofasciculus chthonoplastes]EDX75245.1 carbohydrate-selective porin, OprB family [Coleofasciculus chthonoplastes PCC 7420]
MNQAKVFRIALLNVPTILGIIIGLSTAAIAGEPTRRDNTQQPSSIAQTPLNLEIPVPDAALETEELNPSATPETPEPSLDLDAMENQGMGQITNVSQLRDVSPGDWAYEALRSLVERYGCIAGYPDGTFRGNRAMTRYEFAAGLNACLQQIERLIGNVPDNIEELPTLRRLVEEFEAELATLGARVDNLEGRVAFLEDHQFSTTTKLSGEVIFGLVDAFGDEVGDDVNTVVHDRVRLNFLTSFTGKDMLQTRLQAGNAALLLARDGVTFDDGSQFTQEGRFTYDGDNGNDVIIDILRYRFPLGDKATVQIVANNGLHHYYVDTVNPFLEGLAGGSNAISRFAERNPIYRIGPFGAGAAIALKPSDNIRVDLGYISNTASNPGEDNGLFNGNYSGIAQIVYGSRFKIGLTYVHAYDDGSFNDGDGARRFLLGGTGTAFANLNPGQLANVTNLSADTLSTPVVSNSYGIEASLRFSPSFLVNGWVGKTDARLIGLGDADIWNFALGLVFPDLGKEGSFAAVVAGAEPTLRGLDVPGGTNDFNRDFAYHIEGFYKYQVSDNLSITPGIIWLTAPNQNSDNSDAVIGTVRTTFTF